MIILEKATMPDGTPIQLEDWSEHNSEECTDVYGLTIGAYPIAQRTGKWRWVESSRPFRLTISTNRYSGYDNEQVRADYNALVGGEKKLEDLASHFWYGERDMWFLGMPVEDKGY